MPVIEIENLRKSYRVHVKKEGLAASIGSLFRREYKVVEAVRGIDLTVETGEFVAFLGPNGAGKTTTLKLLSGVITPTSGQATVMGFVPWERDNEYRRRFALVMGQKNQLWWDLPAQESFRLHQQIYRIERSTYDRTLGQLTELLGTTKLLSQPVRELSLGERMKMELTAALLHQPDVLFLDEPTIGLDVVAQHTIQQFLREYQAIRQCTILLTSHYMKDVAALCRRVVIIAGGMIRYDGSLTGIIDQFGKRKLVTLQLGPGARTDDLASFGEIVQHDPPTVTLQVDRGRVAEVLATVFASREVRDVVVEEPPLEQVIADLFTSVAPDGAVPGSSSIDDQEVALNVAAEQAVGTSSTR